MTSGPAVAVAGSGDQQGAAPNQKSGPAAGTGRAGAAGRHHPRRRRPGGRVPGLHQPAEPGRRRPRATVELVKVGPGSPAANTIATVNLGVLPVAGPGGAPGWATGPLLETLTATENLLTGNGAVFSFASPPERQGHLAADALFPSRRLRHEGRHLRRAVAARCATSCPPP